MLVLLQATVRGLPCAPLLTLRLAGFVPRGADLLGVCPLVRVKDDRLLSHEAPHR